MQIRRKRSTNKLISLALALILMLALVPATVSANNNIVFTTYDGKEANTEKNSFVGYEILGGELFEETVEGNYFIVEVNSIAEVYNGNFIEIGSFKIPDGMTLTGTLVNDITVCAYGEDTPWEYSEGGSIAGKKVTGYFISTTEFNTTAVNNVINVSLKAPTDFGWGENSSLIAHSVPSPFTGTTNDPIYIKYDLKAYTHNDILNIREWKDILSFGIKIVEKPVASIVPTPTSTTPTASGNSLSNPNNKRAGAKLGDILNSDIVAYINGNAIPSWNVEKKTVIVAEELVNYGFDVVWSDANQTLSISYNASKKVTPIATTKNTKKPGSIYCPYIASNIRTDIAGKEVQAYNIKGATLVNIEDLGVAVWNETSREIRVTR